MLYTKLESKMPSQKDRDSGIQIHPVSNLLLSMMQMYFLLTPKNMHFWTMFMLKNELYLNDKMG